MAGMVSLSRVDYMQVNPCEHRGTLKLLPFGGHKRQRVVIGDDAGALVCFGIKKFETKMHFTAPLDTGAGVSDVYITRGSNGDAAGRIFSSSGTSVAGVNKRGFQRIRRTASRGMPSVAGTFAFPSALSTFARV